MGGILRFLYFIAALAVNSFCFASASYFPNLALFQSIPISSWGKGTGGGRRAGRDGKGRDDV
jgi:hypothetical protein